jgi:uncharacterized integral membrane protein (TIGR00698 family)
MDMPQDNSALARSRYFATLDSIERIAEIESDARPRRFANLPHAGLIRGLYPGIAVAGTIALAATFLAQHYGAPVMLFALLIGMGFHFLHAEARCTAGIEFCARTILRVGVGLLGVRITAGEIASLGLGPILTVLAGVASTILLGAWLARRLDLGTRFGLLSGGAVAICGASAALAIASVLPAHKNSERDTILVVVAVTTLSTLAMIFYPLLVAALRLNQVDAGIFLGGTIHDVAQVVGAGYMISPKTGDVATYIKLLRVATLIPVVAGLALAFAHAAGRRPTFRRPPVPFFLIGFAALVLLNSLVRLPAGLSGAVADASSWCLVTAIAALGMKTSFRDLLAVGWRPIGLMAAETAWIALLVLAAIEFFL